MCVLTVSAIKASETWTGSTFLVCHTIMYNQSLDGTFFLFEKGFGQSLNILLFIVKLWRMWCIKQDLYCIFCYQTISFSWVDGLLCWHSSQKYPAISILNWTSGDLKQEIEPLFCRHLIHLGIHFRRHFLFEKGFYQYLITKINFPNFITYFHLLENVAYKQET